MDLCFKRAERGDRLDQLIASVTHGPFCHVETRFSDGRLFSAQYGEGVRWWPASFGQTLAAPDWVILRTPWRETPEILAWCDAIAGKPYDYLGAIASGLNFDVHLAGHWFCSGVAVEILSRSGAPGLPDLPHPNALYRWTCAALGVAPVRESLFRCPSPPELVDRTGRPWPASSNP